MGRLQGEWVRLRPIESVIDVVLMLLHAAMRERNLGTLSYQRNVITSIAPISRVQDETFLATTPARFNWQLE